MRVTLAGYLSDHMGRVLLQRVSERSLEPVTCPWEVGQEPAGALADAFRAATGLYVLPVRLVGVSYAAGDAVTLSYRCTLRGGELATPAGQPPAGFFDAPPPPRGLSRDQARQLDDALRHQGGPATLATVGGGPGRHWPRARPAPPPDDAPGEWTAEARLLLAGAAGQVAWTQPGAAGPWRLPAAPVAGQAPWEAAARLREALGLGGAPLSLRRIAGDAARARLSFVFAAAYGGPAAGAPGAVRWAAPDAAAGQAAGDAALAAAVLRDPAATTVSA